MPGILAKFIISGIKRGKNQASITSPGITLRSGKA